MRSVWLSVLVLVCAVSAGWILVQGRPGGMEGALTSALETADLEAAVGPGGVGFGAGSAAASEDAEPTFYRYTDASGSVRFVTSLAEVPPELRDQARPVTQNRVQRAPASAQKPRATPRAAAERPTRLAAAPEPALGRNHDVVVYTTPWCGWCRKTLAFLDSNGIPYENRDIESDDDWRRELIEKTGATSIPVVEINGQIIRGFDPTKMRQLLSAS